MKKQILLLLLVFLSACSLPQNISTKLIETKGKISSDNYLGSYYKDNYVWGGAMNLAWNDLNENILHEKIQLDTKDKTALEMVTKLNESPFNKNDLDEASYYIKSGYGQETVNIINQESRQKFPSKSLKDLDIGLGPEDIIAYAYFLKEVEYQNQFEEKNVTFQNDSVKGFYAINYKQRNNIKILKYWDDDKFIISLQLKNDDDQLFLAKGFSDTSPKTVIDLINSLNNSENLSEINSEDLFEMPKIHLDYQRKYNELTNKSLANKDFTDYYIGEIYENIKFDMDHKGARVENEAAITVIAGAINPQKKPKVRKFILDKPFWVIMKRANSTNPYFILGINNTALLETQ
ncbi:hypothetical protein GYA49_05280 [Candidatus Beckwithbacteria bacterium]|nr:hypothetical protein [Candidatus Beckwithbacteria bacterium]